MEGCILCVYKKEGEAEASPFLCAELCGFVVLVYATEDLVAGDFRFRHGIKLAGVRLEIVIGASFIKSCCC